MWWLATSGWLPFITCLALVRSDVVPAEQAVQSFIVYAALTLSFLGGARWGAELVRAPHAPNARRMVAAALPSVIGLAAMLPYFTPRHSIELLMLCSAAQLSWDLAASRDGLLPAWNARVRAVLTLGGTVCCVAMLLLMP